MNTQAMTYRGYVIVSHYSQGIQAAVQGGHALVELAYRGESSVVKEWASADKTLIFLRGGEPNDLDKLHRDLQNAWMNISIEKLLFEPVPVARFQEPALGNVTTAVATILPVLPEGYEVWTRQEARWLELSEMLKDYRLAH